MYKQFLKQYVFEITLFTFFFIFSTWLMFSTFGYEQGTMLIASKAWSDFANHIPLIRSFTFGNNFPPQDPLFAGQPIHYHFVFYQFVGFLERLGIPLDYALNIPSTLGFFALLVITYLFAKKLFNSKAVATMSVVFFLFNGTLSFLEFFKQHPLSLNTLATIVTNTNFSSFGPYDQKIVSAFWNLNIYTNQRHLAAAFALSLGLIYFVLFHSQKHSKYVVSESPEHSEERTSHVLKKLMHTFSWKNIKRTFLNQIKQTRCILSLVIGIILGLSFFFHLAVFLMTVIVFSTLFILFAEYRLAITIILITGAIIAFPQYLYLRSGQGGFNIAFVPGYLIFMNLTFQNFLIYWFYNLGLHFLLIPLGFLFAPARVKKLFIAILTLFVTGNLFQFAPEMAENHKFFNYFLLVGDMLSAYVLVIIWNKSLLARPIVIIATFLLIFSGIIDFFPIYNDTKVSLDDYPKEPDIQWIMHNTSPHAVFLNTSYLYDNASLAGRKIFLGWPYFPWSSGFDTDTRGKIMKAMLTATNKNQACKQLQENNISYLEFKKDAQPDPNIPTLSRLYVSSFTPIYEDTATTYTVVDIQANCRR